LKELPKKQPDSRASFLPNPQRSHVGIIEVHAANFIDTNGIPLTSDRELPEIVETIDFDYRPNNFRTSPSRYPNGKPHPIPVSGLEQRRLGESYRDMMQAISLIRDGYLNALQNRTDKTGPLSAHELFGLLHIFKFLPHYLSFRAEEAMEKVGDMPPVVLVLSNSAAGTLGALGSWMDVHESDPDFLSKTPNVEEMIILAETTGTMALPGKKTVCAASPAQQKHFMDAVIFGPSDKSLPGTKIDFLEKSEIISLAKFGNAMHKGSGYLGQIMWLDNVYYQRVKETQDVLALTPGRTQEALFIIDGYIKEFKTRTELLLSALDAIESDMNKALGRQELNGGKISLEDINKQKRMQMIRLVSSVE